MRKRPGNRRLVLALAVAGALCMQAVTVPAAQCGTTAGAAAAAETPHCPCCGTGCKRACCRHAAASGSCCQKIARQSDGASCSCKAGGRLPMAPGPLQFRETDSKLALRLDAGLSVRSVGLCQAADADAFAWTSGSSLGPPLRALLCRWLI